jgi:shikimate kinase
MFIGLIGYRGSGKSAVAQLAAIKLGSDWVDADVEIELRAGKSIAAIFADDGEERFRQFESDVLAELLQRDNVVAAFGGGVVLKDANRALLIARDRPNQKFFWLTASPQTLHDRIVADKTTAARRPNLTAAGGLLEVERLLAVREPLYSACADFEIDTENRTTIEVAEQIVTLSRQATNQ